ncbi:helix-turn-helix transcriptional regulator [Paenibacillus sp. MBLB4367]|uniref:helix-turn-helix transcriptional regulator n=1 Tax=Paenibacillus sp. MBLB4367 TaxID=3384767 RepID=UPI003907EE50
MFKDAANISISELITETRLAKAAELLVQHNLSVHEVVEKVGMINETYFFSVFKKRYGATPKEYALQKQLVMLNGAQRTEKER